MINYGHVRFLFSKLFIPVTGRFLKRSPIRTADCSSCQVRALAEAIARDSPASKFASLVHTLPRDASPATSTLGTLVIFVKEAPSASLRPERERESSRTHMYLHNTAEPDEWRERERERLVFTWPSGLSTPSSIRILVWREFADGTPAATRCILQAAFRIRSSRKIPRFRDDQTRLISFLADRSTVRNKTFASLLRQGKGVYTG